MYLFEVVLFLVSFIFSDRCQPPWVGSSKKAKVGETLVTVLLLNSFYSVKLQLTTAVFVSAVVKKKNNPLFESVYYPSF